jgi:hypothetical protein
MHHVLRRISSVRSTTRAVDAWRQCLSTAARSYNVSHLIAAAITQTLRLLSVISDGQCRLTLPLPFLPFEQDAIDALNTLQTSFQGMEARKKAGIKPDASFVREMRVYLRRIGYSVC